MLYVIGFLLLFMWALIIERLVYLRFGHKRLVATTQQLWEARSDHQSWNAHQIRERLVSQVSAQVERNIPMIQTCVALCPLLGLLGTVTGMIEVFDVMAFLGTGNARAMASGVSQATIPTMAGMVVAICGIFFSFRIEHSIKTETRKLSDLLIHEVKDEKIN